jgi:SNF2-related domain
VAGLHGVLADDMGLGKTLQTTAIIAGWGPAALRMRPCRALLGMSAVHVHAAEHGSPARQALARAGPFHAI